ncbi:MAG: hypothetical protein U9Q92_02605, partial [archaeon]|nr:hypothetical protein [archaeon]
SSTDYVIRQTLTNIGDVGMKFKDDLATLTIQTESGGKHDVKFQKIINDDDDDPTDNKIYMLVGKKVKIEYPVVKMTDGAGKFKKGIYELTAGIKDPDTILVPIIDAKRREENNKDTNTITIYDKCCRDCQSCAPTDPPEDGCTKLCPGICRLGTAEVGGGEICKKI